MSGSFEPTRRSLQRLGTSMVPVRNDAPEASRRERIIGAANQRAERIRGQRRSRSRWRVFMLAAGVACGLVLVFGLVRRSYPSGSAQPAAAPNEEWQTRIVAIEGAGCRIREGGDLRTGTVGSELSEGAWVVTDSSTRVRLLMRRRIEIGVSSGSEVRVLTAEHERASHLELRQGSSAFAVERLPVGDSFTVVTPDARVVVHGTRFTVDVEGARHDLVTTVTVLEGRVGVTSADESTLLTSGQRWSSRPTDEESAGVFNDSGSQDDDVARTPRPPLPKRDSLAPLPEPSTAVTSTLAEETRAYMAAMTSKRRGQDPAALVQLDDFLRRYPHSPLAENARVERLRLLKLQERDAAAASGARRRSADHPDGFTRDEAGDLARPSASANLPED